MIKFVSDLRQVGDFLRVLGFPPPIKLTAIKFGNAGLKSEIYKEIVFFYIHSFILFVCLMVFSATFNNISVISWRSVLLVEETGVPGENHRPVASH